MVEIFHEPKIVGIEKQLRQDKLHELHYDRDVIPESPSLKRMQLAQAADQVATSMHSSGMSWAANYRALKTAGINPPLGDASDITRIPGMTRMPEGTNLKPGDVVTIGASASEPHGYSFIVNEDMKAASDRFRALPDLNHEKNVRVFRFES